MHVPVEEYAAEEHRIHLEQDDAKGPGQDDADDAPRLQGHEGVLFQQSLLGDSLSWWQNHYESAPEDGGGHGPVFESYMDALRYVPLPSLPGLHHFFVHENAGAGTSDTVLESLGKAVMDKVAGTTDAVHLIHADTIIATPDENNQSGDDGSTPSNDCQQNGSGYKQMDFVADDAVPRRMAMPVKTSDDTSDLTLEGTAGEEAFHGGAGNDTVTYENAESGVSASLADPEANQGDAKGDTYDSIENLAGSTHSDQLCGDDGDNTLTGFQGHDYLAGEGGDDTLVGGGGDDLLFGDAGCDVLLGGRGEDLLFGGQGNDLLLGGRGSDILLGDHGDDQLAGGLGQDLLYGGQGDDVYVYTSLEEAGDIVLFQSSPWGGHDLFQFSSQAFTMDGEWTFASAALGGREYDGHLGESDVALFLYDTDGGTLWHDGNGSEEGGQTMIAEILGDDVEQGNIIVV